ncbi:hypothetical protein KP806_04095 [Paenibacillus sp. N4]|uniref:hypothetical protein n=1 Tax=Paenibacillus vietnamensis TaxID=2590547 RepID=UPI001CD06979|nr:hypothetical protein [Paenibacillus vietnamensis]MCA0754216.1 hypothetical protein [Paenibacillus vietnamensis]
MVNSYKRFIQNQFGKVKNVTSNFMSSRDEEDDDTAIELNPQHYDELKAIADKQQTTMQAILDGLVAQYLASVPSEAPPISVEQKEINPLLYLDGLCKL